MHSPISETHSQGPNISGSREGVGGYLTRVAQKVKLGGRVSPM